MIERVLIPLPSKMRADALNHGLLRPISACTVDALFANSVFARVDEVDWAASSSVWWFL